MALKWLEEQVQAVPKLPGSTAGVLEVQATGVYEASEAK
jgi:hypothetical protein